MGTRADFYIGRGADAEWLGSIAWDGYPCDKTSPLFDCKTADEFRAVVANVISRNEDFTPAADGWPWPWEDSRTTDYAYAFDGGKVWASSFGRTWCIPTDEASVKCEGDKTAVFPNMTARKKVAPAGSHKSGVMVFRVPKTQK